MNRVKDTFTRLKQSMQTNPTAYLPVMLVLAIGFIVFPVGAFLATAAIFGALCMRNGRT
jgi:hypothetical protein